MVYFWNPAAWVLVDDRHLQWRACEDGATQADLLTCANGDGVHLGV